MAEQPKHMRQLLIEAGAAELNRVGAADFSVRRVAQECGVSCAAPYKHFKDKRDFILAIIEYVNAQWRARQVEVIAGCSEGYRQQLVELVVEYVRFLMEKPCYRSILLLKDKEFNNIYHPAKGELSSRTQRLQAQFFASTGWDDAKCRRKAQIVRSILFGTVFLVESGEFEYSEELLDNLRMAVDREFDLP